MAPLNELIVVDHPEGSEIIFVAHKAFVQRQIGANCVLCALSIGEISTIEDRTLMIAAEQIKQGWRKCSGDYFFLG